MFYPRFKRHLTHLPGNNTGEECLYKTCMIKDPVDGLDRN